MPSLRPYQQEAVEALFQFYSEPRRIIDGKPERKNALLCLPTGSGKSLIIAEFLRRAFEMVPTTRAILSTHVKELIKQDANKLHEAWPLAPLGIYSAGLKKKEHNFPITFGGIQSLVGKYPIFGFQDFLIIDEMHLVGDEGSYIKFIDELLLKNPFLKIIGLTATPYRMGLGCLTNGKIATDIVYNLCNVDGFNRLIAEGYLCPLIPKRGNVEIDISGVGLSRGEFVQSELESAIKRQNITFKALQEAVALGADRKSWLVFATGIEEAEEIGDMLNNNFGISTVVLHSKKGDGHNDAAMKAWKSGEVRCAVNMNMLTTGVDHPALDFIIHLRPTMSTGLWVQSIGRGTRPFPSKTNCLVVDYAGNTRRLGPINDPVVPRLKSEGPPGDAPVRICTDEKVFSGVGCNCYSSASAKFCEICGAEFKPNIKITTHASTAELLKSDLPQVETFKVDRVIYSPHVSKATRLANPGVDPKTLPFTIKTSYYCGLRTFYEWVTVEGLSGRIRGRDWFRQRHGGDVPATNGEVLQLMSELRPPAKIRVWVNANPQPKVMASEF